MNRRSFVAAVAVTPLLLTGKAKASPVPGRLQVVNGILMPFSPETVLGEQADTEPSMLPSNRIEEHYYSWSNLFAVSGGDHPTQYVRAWLQAVLPNDMRFAYLRSLTVGVEANETNHLSVVNVGDAPENQKTNDELRERGMTETYADDDFDNLIRTAIPHHDAVADASPYRHHLDLYVPEFGSWIGAGLEPVTEGVFLPETVWINYSQNWSEGQRQTGYTRSTNVPDLESGPAVYVENALPFHLPLAVGYTDGTFGD